MTPFTLLILAQRELGWQPVHFCAALAAIRVSVVLPAFNEADSLADVVAEARSVLTSIPGRHEILIVDDGSTDGTGRLADALARADPEVVRALHHPRNEGFSGAMASCFREASGEWVFLAPADGQIPLTVLPEFLAASASAEVVIGQRSRRAEGRRRAFLSWGFHALARLLFSLDVKEFSSAFLFRRDVVRARWLSRASAATLLPEVLFRARQRGYRFATVTTAHLPRRAGRSKGARPGVILLSLLELLRVAILVRVRSS